MQPNIKAHENHTLNLLTNFCKCFHQQLTPEKNEYAAKAATISPKLLLCVHHSVREQAH